MKRVDVSGSMTITEDNYSVAYVGVRVLYRPNCKGNLKTEIGN